MRDPSKTKLLELESVELFGVETLELKRHVDNRGSFVKRYSDEIDFWSECDQIRQINHSYNTKAGTFRGMHLQKPPSKEFKFIQCVRGSVVDLLYDARANSSTFGRVQRVPLDQEGGRMVKVPPGVAHGFLTLEDNVELMYFHTDQHHPELEWGFRFDDPLLKLEIGDHINVISDRDQGFPMLENRFEGFNYEM